MIDGIVPVGDTGDGRDDDSCMVKADVGGTLVAIGGSSCAAGERDLTAGAYDVVIASKFAIAGE